MGDEEFMMNMRSVLPPLQQRKTTGWLLTLDNQIQPFTDHLSSMSHFMNFMSIHLATCSFHSVLCANDTYIHTVPRANHTYLHTVPRANHTYLQTVPRANHTYLHTVPRANHTYLHAVPMYQDTRTYVPSGSTLSPYPSRKLLPETILSTILEFR